MFMNGRFVLSTLQMNSKTLHLGMKCRTAFCSLNIFLIRIKFISSCFTTLIGFTVIYAMELSFYKLLMIDQVFPKLHVENLRAQYCAQSYVKRSCNVDGKLFWKALNINIPVRYLTMSENCSIFSF